MARRYLFGALGVAGLAVGWYLFRPELAFIDREVSEALPPGGAAPAADPAPILEGRFVSDAHETVGSAAVYAYPDGRRVLRFTEFETSNGPDVQIYLVAAPAVRNADDVKDGEFVSLGAMKGNRGDQNYDLPADLDLDRFRAVSVWCRRFGVNFGAAALQPGE